MSQETAITHGGVDRAYRLCRCSICGQESRCTPDNDFYTVSSDPAGPLQCDRCMHSGLDTDASAKKQLEFLPSLGGTIGVGWKRDDIPGIFHMFASVLPGERFTARNAEGGPHWPCEVCVAHGYTEADFHKQVVEKIQDMLKKGAAT